MKFGFVTVDYRLCPEVTLGESVHDVNDAWEYVTKGHLDPRLDSQRGIVVAISAGGYYLMQAGVSFQPKPFALLDVYGIPAMTGKALDEKNTSLPEAMTTLDPLFEVTGNALMEAMKTKKATTGSWMDFCAILGMPKEVWLQVGLKNGFEETEWTNDLEMGKPMTMTDGLRAKMSPYAIYNGLLGRIVSGDGREKDNMGEEVPGAPFAERDPMRKIDNTFPPFCSVHGDSDVFVPYQYKVGLVEHLRTLVSGRQSPKLITVPGGDHMMDLMWDVETSQVLEVYEWLSALF